MRARLYVLAALVAVALSASGCSRGGDPPAPSVPDSELAKLKGEFARAYPDWAVERVWVFGSPGGGLLLQQASTLTLLKWSGRGDLHVSAGRYFGAGDASGQWYRADYASILNDRQDSSDFVEAFARRHPGTGWVVDETSLLRDPIAAAAADGSTHDVEYWRMAGENSYYTAPRHSEDWRLGKAGARFTWTPVERR